LEGSSGNGAALQFGVGGASPVEAMELPDGFRSSAAWLADLCATWCERQPERAAAADPAQIEAIVLIDEIDLHLHPALQRELVPRLRAALPKVQWVVTTHSPLVLANFDANEIVALDRDQAGYVRPLDRQILSFSSDEIYQWLMGTRPTGTALDDAIRGSDEAVSGSDEGNLARERVAELMRTSPDSPPERAEKQVSEFKEILKSLER
jgi:AAA domain, putative AbiEii toxin, Type IV TA system